MQVGPPESCQATSSSSFISTPSSPTSRHPQRLARPLLLSFLLLPLVPPPRRGLTSHDDCHLSRCIAPRQPASLNSSPLVKLGSYPRHTRTHTRKEAILSATRFIQTHPVAASYSGLTQPILHEPTRDGNAAVAKNPVLFQSRLITSRIRAAVRGNKTDGIYPG